MPPELPTRPELPPIERIAHVHLIAIAGTAMGSLACMLADRGFRVTGSDLDTYPPMSDQLRAAGIPISKGFAPEHALGDRPDLVVIGNAVRPDNPEAIAVLEAGIPYLSLPEAVHHFFIRGKHSVVIAGTHGKTTTTSLVSWILTAAGLAPSFLIGGVAANFGRSTGLGEGEHFVIEGDEYDSAFFDKTPKFRHYAARSLILTSCEFDHADIYDSVDQIEAVFRQLAESVPAEGRICAATDSERVARIVSGVRAPVEGYGFTEGARWRVSDVSFGEAGTKFNVWADEKRVARVEVPLWGRHSVENVLAAIAMVDGLGVEPQRAADALAEFAGVKRRQELRGDVDGMAVIDDFAHHPTGVRVTLSAMRARYQDRELWAILEPRTNTSRRRFFEDAYAEALSAADQVIVASVHRPEQIPDEDRFRPEHVVARLRSVDTPAVHLDGVDEIISHLMEHRTGRDAVVIMSNGGFGGIWDRLLARLRQGSEAS